MNVNKKPGAISVALGLVCVSVVGGSGVSASRQTRSTLTRTVKADNENYAIVLRSVSLVDGKPGQYVWLATYPNAVGDPLVHIEVYASLYSPQLRTFVSNLPHGAIICQGFSQADPIFVDTKTHKVHLGINDQHETQDFAMFCKAHGIVFSVSPIS